MKTHMNGHGTAHKNAWSESVHRRHKDDRRRDRHRGVGTIKIRPNVLLRVYKCSLCGPTGRLGSRGVVRFSSHLITDSTMGFTTWLMSSLIWCGCVSRCRRWHCNWFVSSVSNFMRSCCARASSRLFVHLAGVAAVCIHYGLDIGSHLRLFCVVSFGFGVWTREHSCQKKQNCLTWQRLFVRERIEYKCHGFGYLVPPTNSTCIGLHVQQILGWC